ncbi:MAG: hypothetical protein ACLQMF_17520 [Rectinemataceae bacterium]
MSDDTSRYAEPASRRILEAVAARMRERNIEAIVVADSSQAREIRKLISAPDFMLGSVSAVTQDGILAAASATASQLGPYASGAGKVILVVGGQ